MDPFIDTKKVAKHGASTCIYLNLIWGISPGRLVDLEIRSKDGAHSAYSTRKASKDKDCVVVYLDKSWGFTPGEDVIVKVTPRD